MSKVETPALPIDLDTQSLLQITAQYDDRQLLWLSGFFFGLSQAKSGSVEARTVAVPAPNGTHAVAPVAAHSVGVTKPGVTILYGSQTGNSKKAANLAAEKIQAKGFDVKTVDMNDYAAKNLKDEKILLITVSTQGEGDPPTAAEEFYAFLHGNRAPKLSAETQFSVLALGDKSYLNFCKTGQDFDAQLAKLGAKRLAERVDCDVDWHDDAERWADSVVAQLANLGFAASANGNGHAAHVVAPKTEAPKVKYDRKNPFEAEVLDKVQLNGRGSVKETWHVELSLADSGIQYQPGDALHVIPTNAERIVADVLKASKLDPSVVVEFDGKKEQLGTVLLEKAELSVLTLDALAKYWNFSRNADLKKIIDSGKQVQEYLYGRDVADLLTDFPDERLTEQNLANIIRKMPSRAYSIASSLAAHDDEVHLTVGAVRYFAHGRKKEGVASSFLADRVDVGQAVRVFVEENEFFKLPKDPSVPVIMVGPGTGIAPFRAFVEERAETGAKGKNWLFFGNPNFDTDFLYQLEWQQYLRKGVLTHLDVAFSRDQAQKIYVQNRLVEKAEQVFDWIQKGAYVYVCGDKNRMAKDVEQAFVQIAMKAGGYSSEKAVDCVKDLKKQRRYLEDVY